MSDPNHISIRSLQVLEAFALKRRPARVSEIHTLLNLPQSSTSKLLRSLARRGYLEHDHATRSYFPTLKVTMLGNWLRDDAFENRALMDIAEDLHQRFGSRAGGTGFRTSVVLGVQNDIHVMYLAELPIIDRPRPPLSVGMLRPLCLAGVGKALMMLKSDEEAGLLIRRINSETTEARQRIDAAAFLEEMRVSRERGYAVSYGGVNADTGAVALPLPAIPHQPRMALGFAVALDELRNNLDQMVEALIEKRDYLAQMAFRLDAV